MLKRVGITVASLASVAGLAWVSDVLADRQYKVSVVSPAKLYSLPPHEYPPANPPVAVFQAGQQVRVLRVRYGKDVEAFRVETTHGQVGWLIGGEGVQVLSRGHQNGG